MTEDETDELIIFLRRNGVFIDPHPDVTEVWQTAVGQFDYRDVRAATRMFLARHPPREVSAAAIRGFILGLMASGKVHEETCVDHGFPARTCPSCSADILVGHRPPELRGKALIPPTALTRDRATMTELENRGILDGAREAHRRHRP